MAVLRFRTVYRMAMVTAFLVGGLAPALVSASRLPRAAHGPSGTLTVAIGYEPASLDPVVDYDTGGNTYFGNVYDRLVTAVGTKNVRIVPDIATSWSESKNGTIWTFHLRPNVKFHDGSPVNAQAVKFTFDRMLAAKQGAYGDFSEIRRVTVAGPLTVQFHLQFPFASFLPSLTCLDGVDIVNPRVVGNHKIGSNGSSYLGDHDAGSGPYELVSYQHHQQITLKAFPGYWGGWSGHHVARIVIEWPASSSTQRLALERGGLDATNNLAAQDYAAVAHESGIVVHKYTAQTIRDIRLNTAKGALRNVLVRRALSYAFDYHGVIQGVYHGLAAKMQGVGPTSFKNFVKATHPYTFDLNKAKSLLTQSKVPKSQLNFTIAYLPDDTQAIQMAQIFQSDLAKIGVTATLQGIPIATYNQVVKSPSTDPDIWIGAWTMDYNDDAQLYWLYYYSKNEPPVGSDVMWYHDPTTDRLLVQALHAKTAKRAYHLFQLVCYRVYAAAPNIWTVQPDEQVALRSNVRGYSYNFEYSNYYFPLYSMYTT
jgi:peptide/nickel transport system substrate-binding protein